MTKERATINSPKTTITDDLISRKDLLNKIFQRAEGRDYDGQNMLDLPYIDLIESMPTITAEPKTAEWIEYTRVLIPEPINSWKQSWYCSKCGYGNQECDDDGWLEWKFCPNCGSRMTEPKEGE